MDQNIKDAIYQLLGKVKTLSKKHKETLAAQEISDDDLMKLHAAKQTEYLRDISLALSCMCVFLFAFFVAFVWLGTWLIGWFSRITIG